MNKIFVIGFPKSGTTSMYTSLTLAGIPSIHWSTDDFLPIKTPNEIIVGISIQKSKYQSKPLLSELNNYQAFTQMEVCIDEKRCYWPQLVDVPLLYQQYPNSKFIFNDRNIDNWLRSLCRWNISAGPIRQKGESLIERIIRLDIPGLPKNKGKTDEELKYWYVQHKNNMMDFFKNKDYFLIFNIELDSGDKLAEFLEIQNFSWFHTNKSL
jgi:protein O-GlcNAc transferase